MSLIPSNGKSCGCPGESYCMHSGPQSEYLSNMREIPIAWLRHKRDQADNSSKEILDQFIEVLDSDNERMRDRDIARMTKQIRAQNARLKELEQRCERQQNLLRDINDWLVGIGYYRQWNGTEDEYDLMNRLHRLHHNIETHGAPINHPRLDMTSKMSWEKKMPLAGQIAIPEDGEELT